MLSIKTNFEFPRGEDPQGIQKQGQRLAQDLSINFKAIANEVNSLTSPKIARVTLVAGSAVVPYSKVTANSVILLTSQLDGGTPGFLRVSSRIVGISFTITSSSATDTSVVGYMINEPN